MIVLTLLHIQIVGVRIDRFAACLDVLVRCQQELEEPHAVAPALGAEEVVVSPPALWVLFAPQRTDPFEQLDSLVQPQHRTHRLGELSARLFLEHDGIYGIEAILNPQLFVQIRIQCDDDLPDGAWWCACESAIGGYDKFMDYLLSGERYRKEDAINEQKWEVAKNLNTSMLWGTRL